MFIVFALVVGIIIGSILVSRPVDAPVVPKAEQISLSHDLGPEWQSPDRYRGIWIDSHFR